MTALTAILSLGLGAVFLCSAVPKLRHPRRFAVTVAAYEVMPVSVALLVARALPPAELALGMLLPYGSSRRIVGLSAVVLLTGFLVAVGVNVLRGRSIECGCFGTGRQIGPLLLAEDGALLAAAVTLVVAPGGWVASAPWSPAAWAGASPELTVLVCLALSGAVAIGFAVVDSWKCRPSTHVRAAPHGAVSAARVTQR